MKKYVTFVKDEEESRKVQEALFSVGFKWPSSGLNVVHTDSSFIRINEGGRHGVLEAGLGFEFAARLISNGYTAIDADKVILDPLCIDGAKKPEEMITVAGKEYSESTLISALRQYVG